MAQILPDALGRRRLNRLLRAHRDLVLKGCGHPEDAPAVEAEYDRAFKRMLSHFDDQALEIVDLRGLLESALAAYEKEVDAPKKVQ